MEDIVYIKEEFIESHTNYTDLVEALRHEFATNRTIVPSRHHYKVPDVADGDSNEMLIMPAFNPDDGTGVKVLNVRPQNRDKGLASIQGVYIYFDSSTGEVQAILDAKSLTNKRTAATSALASSYLSRKTSTSLLMVGTGALAVPLIQAHCAVRPIQQVYIWGRTFEKAKDIARVFIHETIDVVAVRKIEQIINQVDIITCATASQSPLINGSLLRPGQHIDLVGAYRDDMRESDDEVMKRASIYVDTLLDGLRDNGDIVHPLTNGTITRQDIKGDLFSLCNENKFARKNKDEITLFKSVGYALEDLTAARYYYKQWKND